MGEKGARIYDTPGVPNNFPPTSTYNGEVTITPRKPQQFYIIPKLACYVIKNRIRFGSKLCCSLRLQLHSIYFY